MICSEVGCDPTRGVDFRGFSQMVDDEEVLNPWETDSLRRAPIHKESPLPCFDKQVIKKFVLELLSSRFFAEDLFDLSYEGIIDLTKPC